MRLNFVLNGEQKTMEVPGEKRLLDFIREDLHLTGTKEGCGEGECGACTVVLNGQAIHSCLAVAGQLEDSELLTIEGLEKNGELDGMVMSAKALLLHNPNPTQEEIKRAIAGNICRCSGYREIREAIHEAAASGNGGAV